MKTKQKERRGIPYHDLKVVAQGNFEIRTDTEFPVAIVYRSPGMMKEDDERDLARKMAAAPELLEALKMLWEHRGVASDRPASVDKAVLDAIAKAEEIAK